MAVRGRGRQARPSPPALAPRVGTLRARGFRASLALDESMPDSARRIPRGFRASLALGSGRLQLLRRAALAFAVASVAYALDESMPAAVSLAQRADATRGAA